MKVPPYTPGGALGMWAKMIKPPEPREIRDQIWQELWRKSLLFGWGMFALGFGAGFVAGAIIIGAVVL